MDQNFKHLVGQRVRTIREGFTFFGVVSSVWQPVNGPPRVTLHHVTGVDEAGEPLACPATCHADAATCIPAPPEAVTFSNGEAQELMEYLGSEADHLRMLVRHDVGVRYENRLDRCLYLLNLAGRQLGAEPETRESVL